MAYRVIWTDEAVGDLERIRDYILRDSRHYAASVIRRILKSTRILSRFPRSGRVVPEVGDENFREVLVYNYRVIYRIDDQRVTIEAVAHGKQSLGIDFE